MAEDTCGVCNRPKSEHDSPDIHHQFTLTDQLIPVVKEKPKPANAREHIIAPAGEPAAVRLAAILHTKGLIDDEDLVYVLMGGSDGSHPVAGYGATGDLPNRATASAG